VKKQRRIKLALTVYITTIFAVIALGVASPPGVSGDAKTYYYVGGHTFGIGEQQVYLVDRDAILSVRYRNERGDLQSKTFHRRVQSSVAWTIEGLASGGGPILAVVTAAPTPVGAVTISTLQPVRSTSPSTPAPPSPQPSGMSPAPSPMLDSHGAAAPGSALTEVAPASILLSSVTGDLPDIGRPWKSSGDVRLPYGAVTVNLENVVTTAAGNLDTNVMQIAQTGTTSFQAKVDVPGFGRAVLRGAGLATGTSFLESQNKLLLGMSLSTESHGNATANHKRGTYDLTLKIAIKLVKYVPGISPYNGPGGFVPASGYLGGTTAPDTGIYSTVVPDKVGIPAATDTGFVPPPPPPPSPYLSALPEMSLPPIPLPMSSDQPVASPPPGPTPTPQPTHY
jgi:hypothetical protein